MKSGRLVISTVAIAALATLATHPIAGAAAPKSAVSANANGHTIHFVFPGRAKAASAAAAASNNLQYNGGPVEASAPPTTPSSGSRR